MRVCLHKHLIWFAPIGAADNDVVAVIREPGSLRATFGTDTGKQLTAGSVGQECCSWITVVIRGDLLAGYAACI